MPRGFLPLVLIVLVALGAWLWRSSGDNAGPDRASDETPTPLEGPAPLLEGSGTPARTPDAPKPEEAPADPALTVRVLRHGQSVPDAEVVVGNAMAGRERATLSTGRTDADGLVRFQTLTGEKVGVFAAAPGVGRGYLEVALPREGVVDLEMPDDRTVTIHVRRGDNLDPVAGAEVMLAGPGTLPFPGGTGCLPPLPDIRTDANGDAVVSGLPPTYVWIVARAPGLAMRSTGIRVEQVIAREADSVATVTLWPRRVVRFPIKTTGAGAPDEGSTLELHRYQPLTGYDESEPIARTEAGHVVLEPFPPGHDWGHVISPEGTWALWKVTPDKDLGEPVEFRTIYDVRVKLTWKDGTPAVGQLLWVILQPRGRTAPARTDAEGRAVFPRCVAESASVMWKATEKGFGLPVARVNLVADPGETTVAIDRPIDYAVLVRVNGEPRLPEDYRVYVREMAPDRPPEEMRQVGRTLVEDAEKAELRFRWLPLPSGEGSPVRIEAPGMPPATATPVRGADGVWRCTVDLVTSTTLRVRVKRPEGERYHLTVERWSEEHQRFFWLARHPASRGGRRAVEGVHTFRGFAPGRYRVKDRYSNIESKPFDLVAGGGELEIELDLTTSVRVEGRIVVPKGEDPGLASVRFAGRDGGRVSRSNPVRVKDDGTYAFRAASGERHRLLVEHPLLVAKEEPPEIVIGQDVPVIHLLEGPQLAFRIEGSDLTTKKHRSSVPAWTSPVRVRMARPGQLKPEGYGWLTIAKKGLFRVGVKEPGTWDVRIEQPGFVPHLVRGVEVGKGPTDLGTIALGKGATLTVRLVKGDEPIPERPLVIAKLVGDFPYEASSYKVEAGEPPFIQVRGLGRGTFKVVVDQLYVRDGKLAEHEIESDGETDVTLDVRLP